MSDRMEDKRTEATFRFDRLGHTILLRAGSPGTVYIPPPNEFYTGKRYVWRVPVSGTRHFLGTKYLEQRAYIF